MMVVMYDEQEIEQEIESEDMITDVEYELEMMFTTSYDDISIGDRDVSSCTPANNSIRMVCTHDNELDEIVCVRSKATNEVAYVVLEQRILDTLNHEVLHLVLNNVESMIACIKYDNIHIEECMKLTFKPKEIDREYRLIQLSNGSWTSIEI